MPLFQRPYFQRLPKKIWIPVAVVFIVIVVVYIYLEVWATRYVNDVLANRIHGYRGSVSEVSIHLYRGAYQLHDLKIYKLDGHIATPFVDIKLVDLSVQWGALLDGRIVADIKLDEPILNFAVGKNGTKQTGKEANWNQAILALTPFDINRVTITDGAVFYKDFSASPEVDIYIQHLNGQMRNLRNVESPNNPLPATIDGTGTSIGKGKLQLAGALNVLTNPIDMDISTKLENADLTAFNSYVSDFAALDFASGRLSVYAKLHVKKGHVTGYIKPVANDVHVISMKHSNPVQIIWKTLAAVVIEIFTNHSKDQFATQIDLDGNINHPETSTWSMIYGIISNAFFQAFSHSIKNELGGTAP